MADLVIAHFNDVYNIAERTHEPFGGAARFVTAVRTVAQPSDKALVLFSGDVFNPSTMSSVTKGKHMLPVLNALAIDCAVYGNHDVDFGEETLIKLAGQCPFPWLLSNVIDSKTGLALAQGKETVMLTRNGFKIGLMGLIEREWLDTLPSAPPTLEYSDFVEVGQRLTRKLRDEGADIVIALTHMREPNDVELARRVDGLDFVLGGHDHFDAVHLVNGTVVVKSGTDFRNLSEIKMRMRDKAKDPYASDTRDRSETAFGSLVDKPTTIEGHRISVDVTCFEITSRFEPEPTMVAIVDDLCKDLTVKMQKPVGETTIGLDCRMESNRTRESNIGSLLADILRSEYGADIGLLCGGAIRSDDVYGPGVITAGNILEILPFEDCCMVVRVTGASLMKILENGISMVPKMEGRFPQVSGVRFVYDPSAMSGQRIVFARVGDDPATDRPVDLNAKYTIATRAYMASGKDGYEELAKAEIVREEEQGHLLSTLFRRFFLKLKVLNAFGNSRRALRSAVNHFKAHIHHPSSAELVAPLTPSPTPAAQPLLAPPASGEPPQLKKNHSGLELVGKFLKLAPTPQDRILTVAEAEAKGVSLE
ncbi:hypothetical protein CAOG_09034 [Capsaspora owczarzaki ATCC 30864]|nr:hypothetical protein CAOG_09034 [Capsaspora owczarzaki ATCC 30864]|eukprot:XP_011270722.1 hypothetical protein CAOG_09034 [Capsaspora owczarzaki ATCC 30864]